MYINTASGFNPTEIAAITTGVTDWNGQNQGGVSFTVQETGTPPTPPGVQSHVIVINFVDEARPDRIADTTTSSNGANNVTFVNNSMRFFNNIRTGNPALFGEFVRAVASHETGHALGLENADDCSPGSTIMRLNSLNPAANVINQCDKDEVNGQPIYQPTPTPSPTPEPSPTPCAELAAYCYLPGDCCPGTTCGDVSYRCIPCEPNPQNPHEPCMSERCMNCYGGGGVHCTGDGFNCWTPIVIDVAGNGFNLTNATHGVNFNDGNGTLLRTAWTAANSDDSWLVLDRNGNGKIDDGTELFGNATPQPETTELYNGFRALAEYDKAERGGDGNGKINRHDAVFNSLRLWRDQNHDGKSKLAELQTLPSVGLQTIDLDYKVSKRKDNKGNTFKYRAKVKDSDDAQLGRWAWDVFLDARPAQ